MGETITVDNYLHRLFIDEVKNISSGSGVSGGGGSSGGGNGTCDCEDDCECIVPGGCVPDDQIATDGDISDVLDDVFG